MRAFAPDDAAGGPLAALATGVDLTSIGLGLLVRLGRGWLLAANAVLLIAFVYATAFPNPILLFSAILYLAVVALLLTHRSWFQAMQRWRLAEEQATRR
jgi:hypothetical protein